MPAAIKQFKTYEEQVDLLTSGRNSSGEENIEISNTRAHRLDHNV